MYDLVIRNAEIIDGRGTPAYRSSVGILEGRISAIAPGELEGVEVIEASGLTLVPGFVDVHSHGDFLPLLSSAYRYSRIRQGITTELVGQCGIGPIPHVGGIQEGYRAYVSPVIGDIGGVWPFGGLSDYGRLVEGKMPHNMAFLIGLSTLRSALAGLSDRALTSEEIRSMCDLYESCLKEGAYGLSLGLSYLPGVYAGREELLALAEVTARHGGLIMAHIRSHGLDMPEAMEELIDLGRRTGVRVHISHARSYGNKDFGVTWERILAVAQKAREEGIDLTLDQHPYTAGSTFLNQLLPPAHRDPSRWGDRGVLKEIEAQITDPTFHPPGWDNFSLMVGWDNLLVPAYGGTIGELARRDGVSTFRKLMEILILEEGNASMVILGMFSLEDAAALLLDPKTYVGSDGLPSGTPHPRLYGAFPKILGEYVRERGILSMEEAVAKMCGGAELLGLEDRGRVEVGCLGDLVLLDRKTIGHEEIYGEIGPGPTGIAWVFLQGVPVCRDGVVSADRGLLLRKGETGC